MPSFFPKKNKKKHQTNNMKIQITRVLPLFHTALRKYIANVCICTHLLYILASFSHEIRKSTTKTYDRAKVCYSICLRCRFSIANFKIKN